MVKHLRFVEEPCVQILTHLFRRCLIPRSVCVLLQYVCDLTHDRQDSIDKARCVKRRSLRRAGTCRGIPVAVIQIRTHAVVQAIQFIICISLHIWIICVQNCFVATVQIHLIRKHNNCAHPFRRGRIKHWARAGVWNRAV